MAMIMHLMLKTAENMVRNDLNNFSTEILDGDRVNAPVDVCFLLFFGYLLPFELLNIDALSGAVVVRIFLFSEWFSFHIMYLPPHGMHDLLVHMSDARPRGAMPQGQTMFSIFVHACTGNMILFRNCLVIHEIMRPTSISDGNELNLSSCIKQQGWALQMRWFLMELTAAKHLGGFA
ncbi:hypothetical protein ACJX0J_019608, partial [Zea mays]